MGALWNRAERTISYTKNGIQLGVAFRDVSDEEVLFPSVGFRTKEEEVWLISHAYLGKHKIESLYNNHKSSSTISLSS